MQLLRKQIEEAVLQTAVEGTQNTFKTPFSTVSFKAKPLREGHSGGFSELQYLPPLPETTPLISQERGMWGNKLNFIPHQAPTTLQCREIECLFNCPTKIPTKWVLMFNWM